MLLALCFHHSAIDFETSMRKYIQRTHISCFYSPWFAVILNKKVNLWALFMLLIRQSKRNKLIKLSNFSESIKKSFHTWNGFGIPRICHLLALISRIWYFKHNIPLDISSAFITSVFLLFLTKWSNQQSRSGSIMFRL